MTHLLTALVYSVAIIVVIYSIGILFTAWLVKEPVTEVAYFFLCDWFGRFIIGVNWLVYFLAFYSGMRQ